MAERVYFRGLHGLRSLAALAVIVTHVELIKGQFFYNYYYESNLLVFELGSLGVYFFFVLSGFLITYLLLVEKSQRGAIGVKQFYLRRIYRIWPLYFVIVALGFFILPKLDFMQVPFFSQFKSQFTLPNFLLFVLMLPNLALAIFKPLPQIGQTWSIGVEEQFYLLWPWIINKSRNIFKTLVVLISVLLSLKVIVLMIYKSSPASLNITALKDFFAMMKVESMAIGGIGAWMVFEKKYFHKLLNNYILAAAIIATFVLIYFTPPIIQDAIFLIYSVLFLIIILNVSLSPTSFLRLENKLFIFLGTISYGIYMYHLMIIAAVIGFLKYLQFPVGNSLLSQLIVYGASIGLSILVSWLSYRYFEKWFLKLKRKITYVNSGLPQKEDALPSTPENAPFQF